MLKKLISLLIIISILSTLIVAMPITVSAYTYGDLTYTISNKQIKIIGCNTSSSGEMAIPSEIDGFPVTGISNYAFDSCSSLTSVTIPDSVTVIGSYSFRYCSSLTSITIGNSVKSIPHYVFYRCRGLTSVTIGSNVSVIGENAFEDCTALTEVHITDISAWCNIEFGDEHGNPLYYANNLYLNDELITNLTIPDGVEKIYNCAFLRCKGLTSVTIPDSVTVIGNRAFEDCTNLTEVHITDISAWCNIEFGYNRGNPLLYAKNLFLNNELLTDIVIPDTVTKIKKYAFLNCDSLTSITIPDSVTIIDDHVFDNCSSLTNITIPNSITSIGGYAFQYCKSLMNITIPDSVMTIDSSAFFNCSSLTSVNIANIATWCNINFEHYSSNPLLYAKNLFLNNELLTDIVIPDTVTKIKKYAFYNCDRLTSTTIPDSVTGIDSYAFYSCSSLTDVYYSGTQEEWNNITIGLGNECLTNATIHFLGEIKTTYSFVTNGGTAVDDITGEIEVSPVTACEGYKFVGWYDNAELSGSAITFPYSGEITTLYAKWELIELQSTFEECEIVVAMGDEFSLSGEFWKEDAEIDIVQVDISKYDGEAYTSGVEYFRTEESCEKFDLSSILNSSFTWGDILTARDGYSGGNSELDTSITGTYRIKIWVKPNNGQTVSFEKRITLVADEITKQLTIMLIDGISKYTQGDTVPLVATYEEECDGIKFFIQEEPEVGAKTIATGEAIEAGDKYYFKWDTSDIEPGKYYICAAVDNSGDDGVSLFSLLNESDNDFQRSEYREVALERQEDVKNIIEITGLCFEPKPTIIGDRTAIKGTVKIKDAFKNYNSLRKITVNWVDSKGENSATVATYVDDCSGKQEFELDIPIDTNVYTNGKFKVYAGIEGNSEVVCQTLDLRFETSDLLQFYTENEYIHLEQGGTVIDNTFYIAAYAHQFDEDIDLSKVAAAKYVLSSDMMSNEGLCRDVLYEGKPGNALYSTVSDNHYLARFSSNQLPQGTYYLNLILLDASGNSIKAVNANKCFTVGERKQKYELYINDDIIALNGEGAASILVTDDSDAIQVDLKHNIYTDIYGKQMPQVELDVGSKIHIYVAERDYYLIKNETTDDTLFSAEIPIQDLKTAYQSQEANGKKLGCYLECNYSDLTTETRWFNLKFIEREIDKNLEVIDSYKEKAKAIINSLGSDKEQEKTVRKAVLERAFKMAEFAWTPTKNMPYWNEERHFLKDCIYYGMPYTMGGNRCYIEDSNFTNQFSSYNSLYNLKSDNCTADYYGNDCSSFCGFAYGFTTTHWTGCMTSSSCSYPNNNDKCTTYIEKLNNWNVDKLLPGDLLIRHDEVEEHAIMFLYKDATDGIVTIEQGGWSNSVDEFYNYPKKEGEKSPSTVRVWKNRNISGYSAYRIKDFNNMPKALSTLNLASVEEQSVNLLSIEDTDESTNNKNELVDSGYECYGSVLVKYGDTEHSEVLYRKLNFDYTSGSVRYDYKTSYGETIKEIYIETDDGYEIIYEVVGEDINNIYTNNGKEVLVYKTFEQGDTCSNYFTTDGVPVERKISTGINGDAVITYVISENDSTEITITNAFFDDGICTANITSESEQTATVFFAEYKDNKFISLCKKDVAFATGDNAISSDNLGTGFDTVKIMVWDSLTNIKPLGESYGFSVSSDMHPKSVTVSDFDYFILGMGNAKITNDTEYPIDAVIYTAIYDKSGKLTSLTQKNETIEGNATIEFSEDFDLPADYTLKLFVWEKETMLPLAETNVFENFTMSIY